MEGVECGRKWEEMGNDTPGLPPPLAGGHFTLQPPPLNPRPPSPNNPAEAGGGGGGLCDSNNLGKKNSGESPAHVPQEAEVRCPAAPGVDTERGDREGKSSPVLSVQRPGTKAAIVTGGRVGFWPVQG